MRNTNVKRLSTWMLTLALAACGTAIDPQQKSSPNVLVRVQVTPLDSRMAAGLAQRLVATAVYQDGHVEDATGRVTWVSSDPAVATVDGTGLVTSVAGGQAQVAASLLGRSATAQIAVTDATLVSLELVSVDRSVPLGVVARVSARGHFSDGSEVDLTTQASWSVPEGGLLVEDQGRLHAETRGPARICARVGATQAVLELEVTEAEATELRITASRDLAALPTGAQAAVSISATFSDDTEHELGEGVTWTTSPPDVARVEDGRLVGLAVGSTVLTASYHGRSGSVEVTVIGAELVALAVSPPSPTIPLLGHVHLTALGLYSDGTWADLTASVAWTSQYPLEVELSDPLNEPGTAYGLVAGGASVVTAELQDGAISASAHVEVETGN